MYTAFFTEQFGKFKVESVTDPEWSCATAIAVWLVLIRSHASRGNLLNLFLTFFWRQKPFFPSFCEKPFFSLFFSLGSWKLPQNVLFRAYICKKNSWGRTPRPPPVEGKALPHPPHTPCWARIVARRIASCHLVSQKKIGWKNTYLWLKPWPHVTNPGVGVKPISSVPLFSDFF